MTRLFNKITKKQKRRSLRSMMPKAEVLLWAELRNRKLGHRFLRQYSIENYIVDFYCPSLKLVIEVDGLSHFISDEKEQYDKKRQKFIESLGIHVLRFTNDDIYKGINGVILEIENKIKSLV